MAKQLYELKYKHGGFDDFESGLSINREEQVEIDYDSAGKATLTAIANGRLVLVSEPRKEAKKEAEKSK